MRIIINLVITKYSMSKYPVIFYMLFLTSSLSGQNGILTESNVSIETLVRNSLVKGNCKNVSNIRSIGNDSISIGRFRNGNSAIGISSGIILSTGDINLAQGPNNRPESGFALNAAPGNDVDLDIPATGSLYDITAIEFDFVPFGDNVSFNYVFASEEYCEFVGTTFNDVFGFFVSGPGINGDFENDAINVATISTTNQDVSINNVNHLLNEEFYVDNVANLDAEACNIDATPLVEDFIEYDGLTVPLSASFSVIPCETYHIRLVIADVGDPILDSAVLLEANSFDLGEQINLTVDVPGSDEPVAFEECVDAQFVFSRNSFSDLDEEIIVDFSISQDSRAINGIDFEEIPLSITIAPGDTNFVLPIEIIEDGVVEGPENLKLNIPYDCDCLDPVFNELIINDPLGLSANFQEIFVCANEPFKITPNIMGGVLPYSYTWSNGSEVDSLENIVNEDTQFIVTVTDFCGNFSVATLDVFIQSTPSALLAGTYDICTSSENGIPVELEGNPPWTLAYSIDGIEQESIINIETSTVYIDGSREGVYTLTAFSDAYCEGNVTGSAIVENDFVIDFELTQPSCINRKDGTIEIVNIDIPTPYTLSWNIESQQDLLLSNIGEGSYVLSIEDANGCSFEKIIDLIAVSQDIEDCISIYIPNVFNPGLQGVNNAFSIFYGNDSGIVSINSLQIFDRWGSLVFEKINFLPESGSQIWDGRFNDGELNSGVYVYVLSIQYENGLTKQLSGDVSIIK